MTSRHSLILLWLLLCLASAALLLRAEWLTQQERFAIDSSISHRLLSQKITQNEAVLTTLATLPAVPDNAALLRGLQTAMPQLVALGQRTPAGWRGTSPAPAWQSWPQQGMRTVAQDRYRYWLQSPSGWALLIDSRRLLGEAEWPANVGRIQLGLPGGTATLLQRPGATALTTLRLNKTLPGHAQGFAFRSERDLDSHHLPWLSWLFSCAMLALLLGAVHNRWQTRHLARLHAEQQRLAAVGRLSTLNEMAAGMAHELNQPLTAILANLRAASRMLDDDDERDSVRLALDTGAAQAKRAGDIIARLRNMVAPQTQQTLQALDIAASFSSLQQLRQDELAAQGIRLHCQLPATPVKVWADAVALEQILHNLLQNAADALAGRTGDIHLACAIVAGRLCITVSDNGPGLAGDVISKLFQPFFTTKAGGMGLGLSLCETLAHGMGGSLAAANLPAGGACFTLTLPLATEQA